jgi:hypothetical protein
MLHSSAGLPARADMSFACRVSVALPPVPSFGLCPLLVGFGLSSQLVFCGKVVCLDLLHLAQLVAAHQPLCGPWRSQLRLLILVPFGCAGLTFTFVCAGLPLNPLDQSLPFTPLWSPSLVLQIPT